MPETLWTVPELATYLKVDQPTIREWLRSGYLPGFRMVKSWRVTESNLQAFIQRLQEKNH